MHRGTGSSLGPGSRRCAPAPRMCALHRQSAIPDGPGWYKEGERVPHRVRFAMLDAETARWTGMVEDPVVAATAQEFVVPRPASYSLPEPLILVGSGCEASYRHSYPTRAERSHLAESSRRSTFVSPNACSGSERAQGTEEHLPFGRSGGSAIEVSVVAKPLRSTEDSEKLDALRHKRSHREETLCRTATGACSSTYQSRGIFPDLFYSHNPDRYRDYKDDCSAGYTNFAGFMRHSLNKHLTHLEQEGITRQMFDEARKVTPGMARGENKKEKRYLLARQKLFKTPLSDPIPFCEHGDSHPVIKGRIGRSKRRRSLSDGPSLDQPRPCAAPGLHIDNSEASPASHTGPRAVSESSTSPNTATLPQPPGFPLSTSAHVDSIARLQGLEAEFQQWHHLLQQKMFEASGYFNMLDRSLPGTVYTDEDESRRRRLRSAFAKYASLTNELYSKLDDFGESQDFPGIQQQQHVRTDWKQNSLVSASETSLSGHSASSGTRITTNASASSVDQRHSQGSR